MYPDIPSREIHPTHLVDMRGWFAKLKIDGWRCIVKKHGDKYTYLSKSLKPLVVPDAVRVPFEEYVSACYPHDIILDCELTGNRRSGDASSILILDVISVKPAIDRFIFIQRTFIEYAVASCERNFASFFELHQGNPLAEGVVLFKCDGLYIYHRRHCAKHPGIIKCKWRAGLSGTTFKE